MKFSSALLIRGTAWTIGAFGFGQAIRLGTNVVLARLLAPELFGIMVIVNSIRTGVDLISDIGIGQNLVQNKNAEKPDFYNTAWTLGLLRGVLLWVLSLLVALPVAQFYQAPILAAVFPVAALAFVLAGLFSVSLPLLQKRIQFVRLNGFTVIQETISAAAHILLAYLYPTVWALVFGGLIAMTSYAIGSYFMLPEIRPALKIHWEYAKQIYSFGKWIFISSIVVFASMNFDRLYLGKVAAFELLGVYGIARTLSEMVTHLTQRICNYLIFPLVAASHLTPRAQLRTRLFKLRFIFLLMAALGMSILATCADFVIKILYDHRYQEAGWMLPVLATGAWFSVMSNLNEATLLGLGRSSYSSAANTVKFIWLIVALPAGFVHYGFLGAIVVVAAADFWRYFPILVGQFRERFSFAMQDFVSTLTMFALIGLWEWIRWQAGLGTSFDSLPLPDMN
jgi:O-antigen/teichoic acid export membrane protein